jgi:hypothetical protein
MELKTIKKPVSLGSVECDSASTAMQMLENDVRNLIMTGPRGRVREYLEGVARKIADVKNAVMKAEEQEVKL